MINRPTSCACTMYLRSVDQYASNSTTIFQQCKHFLCFIDVMEGLHATLRRPGIAGTEGSRSARKCRLLSRSSRLSCIWLCIGILGTCASCLCSLHCLLLFFVRLNMNGASVCTRPVPSFPAPLRLSVVCPAQQNVLRIISRVSCSVPVPFSGAHIPRAAAGSFQPVPDFFSASPPHARVA